MTLRICHDWHPIEETEITCPYCGYNFEEIIAMTGGEVIRCPHCTKKFKLSDEEE